MKPRKREVTQEKGRIHRKEEKYSSENRVRSLCFIYAQAIKKIYSNIDRRMYQQNIYVNNY
jgi:hypothetical protein